MYCNDAVTHLSYSISIFECVSLILPDKRKFIKSSD